MLRPMPRSIDEAWLRRFHEGDRDVMSECYEETYETVDRNVGRILDGADRETVVHEVFFRLISSEDVRRSFAGGSLDAWVAKVARNLALDFVRDHRRRAYLVIFAADEHGHVYWFHPAWPEGAAAPSAIGISSEPGLHELPEAIAHEYDGDTLVLRALFSDRPVSTTEIERRGIELSRAGRLSGWDEADQTVSVVRMVRR